MKTIAICNLKGGVGKSVTAVNLAGELGRHNKAVLVVDMDKQGNTSEFYGRHGYGAYSVADVLMGRKSVVDAVVYIADNVSLLPANMNLIAAMKEIQFDSLHLQHDRLKKALDKSANAFDVCLIDCPPDIDIGVINALCAADYLLLPADCGKWANDGIDELLDQVDVIVDQLNPGLEVMGILPTKYRHTKACDAALEDLAACMETVIDVKIPLSTAVQDATEQGLTVRAFVNKNCCARRSAMDAYAKLGDWICMRLFEDENITEEKENGQV